MSRQTDFESTSPRTTSARRSLSPIPGARNMPQVLSASAGPQVQIEAQMELRVHPGARTMSPLVAATGPMSPVYGATSVQRGSSSTPPMRFGSQPDPQFSSPRQELPPFHSNTVYAPGQVFPHSLRAMHSSVTPRPQINPASKLTPPPCLLYENSRPPRHNAQYVGHQIAVVDPRTLPVGTQFMPGEHVSSVEVISQGDIMHHEVKPPLRR